MKPVFPQVIHIQLMPSYLLLGLLSGVSIACCWIVLQQAIPVDIKLVIIALIVVSSAYFIHEACTILNFKGRGVKYNVFRLDLQPVILFDSRKNDN